MTRGAHVPARVRSKRNADLQRPDACDVEPVLVWLRHEDPVAGAELRRLQGEHATQAAETGAEVQELQLVLDRREVHARNVRECLGGLVQWDQRIVLDARIVALRWPDAPI